MKLKLLFIAILFASGLLAQNDSVVIDVKEELDQPKRKREATGEPTRVFYSQRLINANTVEVLNKGIMEFKVVHNFGDIAGDDGGIKNFFGLDNAFDIKIGFHIGLSDKLNLVAARAKGSGSITQLWELGLKYKFLQQMDNDPSHPLSLTVYANTVVSSMEKNLARPEANFIDFSDRLSQLLQLMIARKFGNVSLQLSPTYVHTNYVIPGDDKSVFALGGAIRLPFSKKFILIADYFHPFRSDEARAAWRLQGDDLYDTFGIGVEILTEGHIFHLNFTNAGNILENRFIPRTRNSWGDGQYRWGFTIARRFVLFTDKKH